jgi:hypothetical protein
MNALTRPTLRALLPCALGIALPAGAANPPDTSYAEKSSIVGTGQVIHLYGLPTTDVTGALKYYDVTLTLTVNDNGVPTNAALAAVKSPTAKTNQFVPGTYGGPNGETCTLQTSAFGGRVAVDLSCTVTNGMSSSFSWWTGPIAGNPLETQLVAAKLDQLPGNEQYAWGRMNFRSANVYWFGCMLPNDLVSARQVGNTISITDYRNDNIVDCASQIIKQ